MSTKDKQRLWFCSDYGIENKAIYYAILRLPELPLPVDPGH